MGRHVLCTYAGVFFKGHRFHFRSLNVGGLFFLHEGLKCRGGGEKKGRLRLAKNTC